MDELVNVNTGLAQAIDEKMKLNGQKIFEAVR
jgi:hypothetical protein